MPAGSLMEPRQNMVKSMVGVVEKPAILFTMFFNLGKKNLRKMQEKKKSSGILSGTVFWYQKINS